MSAPIALILFVTKAREEDTINMIIAHVKFQQSNWSIDRVTILNTTEQRLTMVFVVEMGHSVWKNKYNMLYGMTW